MSPIILIAALLAAGCAGSAPEADGREVGPPPKIKVPPDPPKGDSGEHADACEQGITYRGACDEQTAVWCDPDTHETIVWDCPSFGLACGEDNCAEGAYCCGTPPPTSDECATLGFYGECSGMTARWCEAGEIVELACQGGQTCERDKCAVGAYCCDP